MKIIYSFLISLFMLHATGDPVIKINLNPIAVGSHGHVLFSTYKYANAHGSTSYNEHEFGWLVVEGRTGKWDERKAYHYDGKNKNDVLYQKYINAKIGLKNPDNVLKEMMNKYYFTVSSKLKEHTSYVYAIKANQSCFDSGCMERTTIQKTLGEKKSKVLHSPIRSSFYYRGVALFHNTYKRTSDIGDPTDKSNIGAVFDFKQEMYRSVDDGSPNLYPYSDVDGLVLFDPFIFRVKTKINLAEIRKQIESCESKNSKHKTFKLKNAQWDICQANKQSKIITIEYKQKETKHRMYTEYKELYVVNHGKLEYAFEQQSDSRKGHQWIWNCQFAIINETQAEVLSSLGHGKTEDDNWDANEIIEMYKKRMKQLKENKYLYFSNGNLSNIDVSCKKDDDCMLTHSLQMGCSHFIAVNKKLTQKDIEVFNAKEGIFWITKDLECWYSSEEQLKKFTPKCVDKVCGMSNGKVTYVYPLPACGMDEELRRLSEKKKPISTTEYKKRLEQRLPECTPRLIEQHIKKEMKRYSIERKLTSPPPCIHSLVGVE